jgi:hypothetical protein
MTKHAMMMVVLAITACGVDDDSVSTEAAISVQGCSANGEANGTSHESCMCVSYCTALLDCASTMALECGLSISLPFGTVKQCVDSCSSAAPFVADTLQCLGDAPSANTCAACIVGPGLCE